VLFLDEPTTGVDAVSRKEFWDMLKKLKDQDITILVSTPYMDEASRCDRVALMQQGNILVTDTPGDIVKSYRWPLLSVSTDNMFDLPVDLQGFEGARKVYRFGEFIHMVLKDKMENGERLLGYLQDKGHQHVHIEPATPSIEDCFMDLMHME
jgi:ABC-type multidrug transport system ATPase subunit